MENIAKVYNNILVDFKMMIDTDYGLIQTIKKKYANPKYINTLYLNRVTKEGLCTELLNMNKDDPLSLIINDNSLDTTVLYNQLYDNEYNSIIDNAINTNVFRLINMYKMTETISITVLCKNKQEEHFIINKMNGLKTILWEELMTLEPYDSIFINSIYDIKRFKYFQAKNIFISNHRYNFDDYDKKIPKFDIISSWVKSNKISVIDLYDTITYNG